MYSSVLVGCLSCVGVQVGVGEVVKSRSSNSNKVGWSGFVELGEKGACVYVYVCMCVSMCRAHGSEREREREREIQKNVL